METKPNGCVGELKNKLNEMLEVVVVPEMSGIHEQCIYKVPPRIRQGNPQVYTPQIISIGPFHSPHGSSSDNILHQMEQLKLKYLKGFLTRTNLSLDDFIFKFQEWENRIRSCYAEVFGFNSNDFLKIIIIDACFIIEHFLRVYKYQNWKENDPILLKRGLCNDIVRDLMLLENQLPFFVLEEIYKLAGLNNEFPSFLTITIDYFKEFNLQEINSERVECPKHFTDLLRTFLLLPTPPSPIDSVPEEEERVQCLKHFTDLLRTFLLLPTPSSPIDSVPEEEEVIGQVNSVSQLSEAGLEFEVSKSKCLLDLNFDDKSVLKMPCFHVHDGTYTQMRNILAFEECHISDEASCYISQYFSILDFLINTEKDVSILVDKKIIVNWMGDANAAAAVVNNLSKDIIVPELNSKYKSLCKNLNDFYENPMNKYKAIFVHQYFNTPWKIASTLAAVLLLLLTLIQTVCSIVSLLV